MTNIFIFSLEIIALTTDKKYPFFPLLMAREVIGTQLKTGNVLYYASGVATQDRSSINSQPAVMLDHRSKCLKS